MENEQWCRKSPGQEAEENFQKQKILTKMNLCCNIYIKRPFAGEAPHYSPEFSKIKRENFVLEHRFSRKLSKLVKNQMKNSALPCGFVARRSSSVFYYLGQLSELGKLCPFATYQINHQNSIKIRLNCKENLISMSRAVLIASHLIISLRYFNPVDMYSRRQKYWPV